MRRALILLIPLIFAQGAAAGPWPREEGTGFAAVSPQLGAGVQDTAPAFGEIYAEYGATPAWTFGLNARQGDKGPQGWTGTIFARRHLWSGNEGDVISAELGLGYLATPDDGAAAQLRPGLSWGRGFGGDWGDGWLSVEARADLGTGDAGTGYKADFTAGLKPRDGVMLMMQVQTNRNAQGEISARLAPSAVMTLSDGVQMQLSVAAGVVNDRTANVSLGAWLDF